MISELGQGTYDHMGFFGTSGPSDAVIVGNYQDSTFVVDASGNPNPSVWGALMNNKYLDASGVSISGMGRIGLESAALQSVAGQASGTLLVWFRASGALTISTYNAKLFAYDNTATIYDSPGDVTLMGYEINASGLGSSAWSSLQGFAAGLNFADHSPATAYMYNVGEHKWWMGISARADAVGLLDDFDLVFRFSFA